MAPTLAGLDARDSVCGPGFTFNGRFCVRSGWHFWGRWVLAGILLLVGFLLVVFCLCCSARARRRGNKPFGGTGWLGRFSKNGHQQQQPPPQQGYYGMSNQGPGGYAANQQYQYQGPPAYGQPPQDPYNQADGYYTGQQYGVQRPDNAYQPPK